MIDKPKEKINYKKRLWKLFSEYIRRRDGGRCYTCSTVKSWKEMNAGHYIPAGQSPPPLYFDERNVHCQCTSCNRFKHGNATRYAEHLIQEYGADIFSQFSALRANKVKWNSWTYQIKIDEYKKKLEDYGTYQKGKRRQD